jgi:hypothetical protein
LGWDTPTGANDDGSDEEIVVGDALDQIEQLSDDAIDRLFAAKVGRT